jgi:monooxygenase
MSELLSNDGPTGDAHSRHVDVLVVGAGLSGIGAGYYLQTRCPGKSFAILEARQAIGGTWDLFRYPGVRSDSDMYTLGFSFRPWQSEKSITEGPTILEYIRDTAREYGIDRKISFGHRARRASWNSAESLWTVEVEVGPQRTPARYTCSFLYLCAGYYDYDAGYMPGWPGMERFAGRIIHPQQWPEDLDYRGRRVVVIGSGATAMTLVPAMAETAAHVTMVQRSPTYVVALPARDGLAHWLRRWLPAGLAHSLVRWKNVLLMMYFYNLARRRPEFTKEAILRRVREALGPDYDVERHFAPLYNPWDQRLCVVPDADLFEAIRLGKVSVVTDEIASFTEAGLELRSGARFDADIIVTATGLNVKLIGMQLVVDGVPVDISKTLFYKGMMLSDVPNMAVALGYTNASWTLKCELTSSYVCRLINRMDKHGEAWCVPRRPDAALIEEPALGLTSGYVKRAANILPKQGSRKPWRLNQNYALDMAALRFGNLDDGAMEFVRRDARRRAA